MRPVSEIVAKTFAHDLQLIDLGLKAIVNGTNRVVQVLCTVRRRLLGREYQGKRGPSK